MIGRRLKDLQTTNPPKEPNAYLTWINNYVADDYTEAVRTGRGEDISSTLKNALVGDADASSQR